MKQTMTKFRTKFRTTYASVGLGGGGEGVIRLYIVLLLSSIILKLKQL